MILDSGLGDVFENAQRSAETSAVTTTPMENPLCTPLLHASHRISPCATHSFSVRETLARSMVMHLPPCVTRRQRCPKQRRKCSTISKRIRWITDQTTMQLAMSPPYSLPNSLNSCSMVPPALPTVWRQIFHPTTSRRRLMLECSCLRVQRRRLSSCSRWSQVLISQQAESSM